MNRPTNKPLWSGLLAVCLFGFSVLPVAAQDQDGIPAKLATDYIHSILEASRQFYSQEIVGRLNKKISLKATENWKAENTLPLPAQFLKLSAQQSNDAGIGLKIRLLGLNPINAENKPGSDLETLGLRSLRKGSKTPFTWVVKKEGTWNFQAIYPDLANAESCVSCHNNHPKSPKTDYEEGDVMGGILINIPLLNVPLSEKGVGGNNDVFNVPPQIVSDYVHAILESDRYVYTEHVVKRMKANNIVVAKESWVDDNVLPLPAQYLLNTSRLARKNKLGLNFRLISLWPINFNNSAANEFERKALVSVEINPLRPYMGKMKRGRATYFQAVYPDFAVNKTCVQCHNDHPKSPKKDFQLDDLMGGMIVSFPMKKAGN